MNHLTILSAAVLAAGLAGCTKNEILVPGPGANEKDNLTVIAAPTFKAEVENDEESKTTIDEEGKVSFVDGETISVNGTEYSYNATTGFFGTDASQVTLQDNKFHAYYPFSLYNNGTLSLPAEYDYATGFNMPMYSCTEYAPGENQYLAFRHLTGFLALRIKPETMSYIKTVTASTDLSLSGTFSVADTVAVMADGGQKYVTVNVGRSNSANGLTVYVPMPVKTYGKLMLSITGTVNGVEDSSLYMITKDTKADGTTNQFYIARNKLFMLDFSNNFKGAEIAVATETYDEDGRY